MLKAHLDAVEKHLVAVSQIPANAGHTLHRGTPREAFIREFLLGHLSVKLAVGTGEIIDATSKPREQRNQYDIVIYKADYPKIDLGGGINAFLAESVVATIEVKSILTEEELDKAVRSASNAKKLQRHLVTSMTTGYIPPGILSYVIAYDGPAKAKTVQDWLLRSETKHGLNQIELPSDLNQRLELLSESLEGVFCLGRHSVIFDNSPVGIVPNSQRVSHPKAKRVMIESTEGNLLLFFLVLTYAGANLAAQWANLLKYVENVSIDYNFGP